MIYCVTRSARKKCCQYIIGLRETANRFYAIVCFIYWSVWVSRGKITFTLIIIITVNVYVFSYRDFDSNRVGKYNKRFDLPRPLIESLVFSCEISSKKLQGKKNIYIRKFRGNQEKKYLCWIYRDVSHINRTLHEQKKHRATLRRTTHPWKYTGSVQKRPRCGCTQNAKFLQKINFNIIYTITERFKKEIKKKKN